MRMDDGFDLLKPYCPFCGTPLLEDGLCVFCMIEPYAEDKPPKHKYRKPYVSGPDDFLDGLLEELEKKKK